MIEGFRHFSFKREASIYAKTFIFFDFFLFAIDLSIVLFYIPGLIAAIFFHKYLIVGPMTLLLFPITLILFGIMMWSEHHRVFKILKLKLRKHFLSFLIFTLVYSIILSPTCIKGYIQEFLGTKRKWK